MPEAPAEQTWLSLLLGDSEAGDYELFREKLASAAPDTETHRKIVDEARRAEELRGRLAGLRRRAGDSATVYDLALRLSAVHDVKALLQDIVTQARRLLDVDIAYLAL